NLVWAMITGHKPAAPGTVANDRPFAGRGRLAIMAILVLMAGIGLFGPFDGQALATRPSQPAGEASGGVVPDVAAGLPQSPAAGTSE
ncbi:MAG: hypothetical protein ACREFM_23300, partial [Hypericibacter sp.]